MTANRNDEPAPPGDRLCFTVYSTAHAFNRIYKPLLEALDLTYPQYLVMLVLWEADGRTVKDIGEHLFLDSGTLTPLLKRLEAAGLVRRGRDPHDERQVRVHLTAAGRSMREKAETCPKAFAAACGMTDREMKRLNAELTALRDRLNTLTD